MAIIPSPKKFAGRVADLRNALVHDPRRRGRMAVSGRDQLRMTEQLTFLVTAYLLRDLGFEDDRVMEMLRATRRHRLVTEGLGD